MIILFPLIIAYLSLSIADPPGRPRDAAPGEVLYVLLPEEGNIGVVDPVAGLLKRRIQVGSHPEWIVSTPDRRKVYVSNTHSTKISIVDVQKESVIGVLDLPVEQTDRTVGQIVLSPSTGLLYAVETSTDATPGTVYVYDSGSDKLIRQFPAGQRISGIAVSGDGKKVFVVNNRQSITVYDAGTGTMIGTLDRGTNSSGAAQTDVKKKKPVSRKKAAPPPPVRMISGIACHPKNSTLYVAYGRWNQIESVNGETLASATTIPVTGIHQGEQDALACSPDGTYLLIANHKTDMRTVNSVLLVSCETGQIVKLLDTGYVRNGMTFSLDGQTLYTASMNLHVYNILTFALIKTVNFQTPIAGMLAVPIG